MPLVRASRQTMNSLTRTLMSSQVAKTHSGVRKVVSMMSSSEKPSMPM